MWRPSFFSVSSPGVVVVVVETGRATAPRQTEWARSQLNQNPSAGVLYSGRAAATAEQEAAEAEAAAAAVQQRAMRKRVVDGLWYPPASRGTPIDITEKQERAIDTAPGPGGLKRPVFVARQEPARAAYRSQQWQC